MVFNVLTGQIVCCVALFSIDLSLCLLLKGWIDSNQRQWRLLHAHCLANLSMFASHEILHAKTYRFLLPNVNCPWMLFSSMFQIHAFPPSSAPLPGGILSTNTRLCIERSWGSFMICRGLFWDVDCWPLTEVKRITEVNLALSQLKSGLKSRCNCLYSIT